MNMTMLIRQTAEVDTNEDTLQDIVSRNIKIALVLHETNQKELAKALGFKPSAISQKMAGSVNWNLVDIEKAAHFFGVRPERLVAGSGFEPETSGL